MIDIQLEKQHLNLVEIAKVLTNPTRVKMLLYLERNNMAMCSTLTRLLGIPQDQASKALKKMRECGLIKRDKVGSLWLYSLEVMIWNTVKTLGAETV